MYKAYDIRVNSLQEAVRFAKYADLAGIVTVSDPILEAPRLVSAIKSNDLKIMTYGGLNNQLLHFQTQKDIGVDAVITDSIKLLLHQKIQ
jgi:glycerophosphodiester phosphodiesterase